MFFGTYAKLIPMPVLAGILIVVAYNMSEWRSFICILKGSPFDIIVLLATFFLTVLVDLTMAIQVGVVLSSLLFMKRMSDIADIPVQVEDDDLEDYSKLPDDIHTYEISGPLFFGSAKRYAQTISEIGNNCKILIIRMRYVPFVDSTAIHNLKGLIEILHASGVTIVLSGVNISVQKDFEKAGLNDLLGKTNILSSYDKALAHAKNILERVE